MSKRLLHFDSVVRHAAFGLAFHCNLSRLFSAPGAVERKTSAGACSDFERLLVAMTSYLHQARKRKEPLDEYLGEIMDFVYRKASVLQEAQDREEEG